MRVCYAMRAQARVACAAGAPSPEVRATREADRCKKLVLALSHGRRGGRGGVHDRVPSLFSQELGTAGARLSQLCLCARACCLQHVLTICLIEGLCWSICFAFTCRAKSRFLTSIARQRTHPKVAKEQTRVLKVKTARPARASALLSTPTMTCCGACLTCVCVIW